MIATIASPALASAPVATLLGTPPLPTLYEIRWKTGRVSAPFVSYEQAAEWALESGGWLASEQYFVDDDGRVYTVDADGEGVSKCIVGVICEVGR